MQATTSSRVLWSYTLVQKVLGVILIAASLLKAYELATEPTLSDGLFDSRWVQVCLVEFELLFGLWLLSGIVPNLAWTIALACFCVFALYSLNSAIAGNASCGCFGRVPLDPRWTTVLDVTAIVLLLRCRPPSLWPLAWAADPTAGDRPSAAIQRRAAMLIVVWVAVSVPVLFAAANPSMVALSDADASIGNGKVVLLSPEKWVGEQFPLHGYIDKGDQLRRGSWIVLFYHHDCPQCQAVIEDYELLADRLQSQPNGPRIALIEMPPFGYLPQAGSPLFVSLKIEPVNDWFIKTPSQVKLHDGMVQAASTELESAQYDNQAVSLQRRTLRN